MQLLMLLLSQAYQKLRKTIETPPPKVNIERATAICLQKKFKNILLLSGCKPFALALGLQLSASRSGLNNQDTKTTKNRT